MNDEPELGQLLTTGGLVLLIKRELFTGNRLICEAPLLLTVFELDTFVSAVTAGFTDKFTAEVVGLGTGSSGALEREGDAEEDSTLFPSSATSKSDLILNLGL